MALSSFGGVCLDAYVWQLNTSQVECEGMNSLSTSCGLSISEWILSKSTHWKNQVERTHWSMGSLSSPNSDAHCNCCLNPRVSGLTRSRDDKIMFNIDCWFFDQSHSSFQERKNIYAVALSAWSFMWLLIHAFTKDEVYVGLACRAFLVRWRSGLTLMC